MAGQATRQGKIESVMTPGMTIRAMAPNGTIQIAASVGLIRSYTWEGATRSVELVPYPKGNKGSLGLYYLPWGDQWPEHHGIARPRLEEGQQHFKTLKEAEVWIRRYKQSEENPIRFVYRDDGLMVGWKRVPSEKELQVEVWQLYIGGKKPQRLPGSQNHKIVVTNGPIPSAFASLPNAIHANQLAAVNALLAKGADPSARDLAGTAVLSVATGHGYTEIVRVLLEKGANPNIRNDDGSTALLRAIANSRLDLISLLIGKGANVNVVGEGAMEGFSALVMATMDGDVRLVETLLRAGADVKVVDRRTQTTALAWASKGEGVAIAKLLLAKGAEVDSRDGMGLTPLMGAASAGNPELVTLLLSKGAKVNARDDATRQEYGRAQFMGDTKTVEQIRQSGKLKTLHEDGRSVLDWAHIGGNTQVIALLKRAGANETKN